MSKTVFPVSEIFVYFFRIEGFEGARWKTWLAWLEKLLDNISPYRLRWNVKFLLFISVVRCYFQIMSNVILF